MTVQIGFSDTFFGALTKLPPNIQAKVNKLVLKFQSEPTALGLNYEKITAAKDESLRSLRADKEYRVILAAPEEGALYLFLWVDKHDEAYDWALRHKCRVNPNTGAIQLYATQISAEDGVDQKAASPDRLFGKIRERQLLKLGVPEEHLHLVQSIATEEELDALQEVLPQEAYEGLFYLAAGDNYEDILRERAVKEDEQFDSDDFVAALDRDQSKARFVVPDSEKELAEMLNAPMDKWRVFLHPSQRRLATGVKSGAVRVLGGAGTGKTVVAMHRAKWLAQEGSETDKKILFTTFTRNLAVDIKRNLQCICDLECMKKLEVVNLDQWVQRFLRKHDYDFEVVFDQNSLDNLWKKAISEKPPGDTLPDTFFREEWARVIQPQGIKTLNDYKRASRLGRGTRLNRQQRVDIWPVFEEYRHQLNRARLKEVDDAYRDAAALIETQKIALPFDSIVVDEAQDMGTEAFKLLRAMVPEGPNDLFMVGDAHQRIYGRNHVVLGRCGINVRGRSKKLRINYRTTEEIRAWATRLLEGGPIDDLDGGSDTNAFYKSLTHGQPPLVKHLEGADEQADCILEVLSDSGFRYSSACVIARTNREVAMIQEKLEQRGLKTSLIRPQQPEEEESDALKLATMHRVKGLEFDIVILASANRGLIPLDAAVAGRADVVSEEDADMEERCLVYVAVTRARKSAIVLSYGEQSKYF